MAWYDQTYPLNINPFKNAAVGVSDYIGQFKGNDPTTWLGGASGQAVDALQQHKIDTQKAIGDQSSNFNLGNVFGMSRANAAMPTDAETMAVERSGIMQGYRPNMRNVSGEYIDTGPNLSGVNLDDTSGRHMKLKGEPFFGNYQKFPQGDQWRNKDKYLRSQDYLSTLEPSEAGAGYDRRGFNLPNFGLSGIMKGIKDQFEYRPSTETAWDPNTGEMATAEEQDKMNALGGYYSDAARNQRRQRARVMKMIKRRDADQAYSEKNLARLQKLGYGPKETITTTAGGPQGYRDYGQGAASQEIQGSYEGPGGGYTGAGEAADWGGGEAYGGLMTTRSRGRYNKGGRVGILSIF